MDPEQQQPPAEQEQQQVPNEPVQQTPPEGSPSPTKGYGKRPLWQWVILYLIVAIIVYIILYLVFFHHSNNGSGTGY